LIAAALFGASVPAMAFGDCADGRCAQIRRIPPPKPHHSKRKQLCCCEAPPGWGWYRRQKFYHDCSQPLVVFDELDGAVSVHRNW
jgi:hypothetical protein